MLQRLLVYRGQKVVLATRITVTAQISLNHKFTVGEFTVLLYDFHIMLLMLMNSTTVCVFISVITTTILLLLL